MWTYRIILVAIILALLGFIASFIYGSYRFFPEESKDFFVRVSIFSYDVLRNQRPVSEQKIWKKTQLGRIWMFLAQWADLHIDQI